MNSRYYPVLPLEQRIGALCDGDVTHHGEPVGSMPLTVQPPRRPDMDDDNKSGWRRTLSERGQQQAVCPPSQSPPRTELPKYPPPSPNGKADHHHLVVTPDPIISDLCDQLALALTTAAANEVEFDDDCWATINAALAAYDKHKEARRD